MRQVVLLLTVLLSCASLPAQEKTFLRGFDGGMMLHSGYLQGSLAPIGYEAKGVPLGIGGVIRLHLGEHFRVGTEGYVSTLRQRGNGSYLKYGWGGLLADVHVTLGKFQPFAGVTLGGGVFTTLLLFEEPAADWAPVGNTIHHKQGFIAVDPFIGCEFIVSEPMHLTLKLDWLNGFDGKGFSMPTGPRLYFGFLFYH